MVVIIMTIMDPDPAVRRPQDDNDDNHNTDSDANNTSNAITTTTTTTATTATTTTTDNNDNKNTDTTNHNPPGADPALRGPQITGFLVGCPQNPDSGIYGVLVFLVLEESQRNLSPRGIYCVLVCVSRGILVLRILVECGMWTGRTLSCPATCKHGWSKRGPSRIH